MRLKFAVCCIPIPSFLRIILPTTHCKVIETDCLKNKKRFKIPLTSEAITRGSYDYFKQKQPYFTTPEKILLLTLKETPGRRAIKKLRDSLQVQKNTNIWNYKHLKSLSTVHLWLNQSSFRQYLTVNSLACKDLHLKSRWLFQKLLKIFRKLRKYSLLSICP